MKSQMKHSKDILLQEDIISIDMWVTILSYLKDNDGDPVNPDQFIAIMKMGFVNKSLMNMTTSNMFWVLYNNIEYNSVKYNIYEWNCNFCRMLNKTRKLKTIKDMKIWKYDDIEDSIFIRLYHNREWHTFNICNGVNIYKNVEVMSQLNQRYVFIETEYCILFEITSIGSFYLKKQPFVTHNYKLKDFVDFCDSYNDRSDLLKNIDQFKYFKNRTDIICHPDNNSRLYDNYIWTTEISMHNDINYIKFYAQNVITNIKYLLNEIEIKSYSFNNDFFKCYFDE